MAIKDHMPTDPQWFMRMAELEGDHEIGAGFELTGELVDQLINGKRPFVSHHHGVHGDE